VFAAIEGVCVISDSNARCRGSVYVRIVHVYCSVALHVIGHIMQRVVDISHLLDAFLSCSCEYCAAASKGAARCALPFYVLHATTAC
jgi:hypothetical protein